jgi:lipoyl-dependent peroxiredoxin subunit D
MHTEKLRESIKDFAKDIRLNLSSVLTEEGAPGLTAQQIWAVALACAYSTKSAPLIEAVSADSQSALGDLHTEAAKSAAAIMAMNNIYYRFLHLSDDKEFSKMPAKLRMNVIGKPGIEKRDFELMCLAVSALSGCGSCINSHVSEVKKAGVTNEGIQSSIRIASVINAAALALTI